jgi:hypothetical protein
MKFTSNRNCGVSRNIFLASKEEFNSTTDRAGSRFRTRGKGRKPKGKCLADKRRGRGGKGSLAPLGLYDFTIFQNHFYFFLYFFFSFSHTFGCFSPVG